jgi:hypothetical protein
MHAAFTDRIYDTWLSRVVAYAQAEENAAAPR